MLRHGRAGGLFAFALLIACTDLPPLASGTCGNAVREAGEDCDTFADAELGEGTRCAAPSDSTRACRYVCVDDTVCPTGWACGGEGICRYSTGQFLAEESVRLSADRLALGDFDGDDHLDVLGVSGSSLDLAYGTGDGRFAGELTSAASLPNGIPALGDLDQDGRSDVVVPTEAGLVVLLGTDSRSLDAVAYSPIPVNAALSQLRVQPVLTGVAPPFDIALFLVESCMLFDPDAGLGCAPPRTPFPAIPGQPLGRYGVEDVIGRIPRGDLDGDGLDELVLALGGVGKPSRTVYLLRTQLVLPSGAACPCAAGASECGETVCGPSVELYAQVSLPADLLHGVRLADLDGDGDLDLLASLAPAANDQVAVALNDGNGRFRAPGGALDSASIDPIFDELRDASADVPQRWPLAVGSLNSLGDDVADFVGQRGVYLRAGPDALIQTGFRTSASPWSDAVIADFNRDGLADVAAAGDNERGIDFLNGTGNGLFNPDRVETVDAPFHLRADDFDGDLVNDLAFAERGLVQNRRVDSLSVMFGNLAGAPGEPVSMGRLGLIDLLEPMRAIGDLLSDVTSADFIADLAVQSRAEGGVDQATSLAIMQGSAQRRLISPFKLFRGDEPLDEPLDAVVGRFLGNDAIPDVLIVTEERVWGLRGAGEARFNADEAEVRDLADLLGPTGDENFSSRCTLLAAGDLDEDGGDEAILVDMRASCFGEEGAPASNLVILRWAGTGGAEATRIGLGGQLRGPNELHLADVDADGHVDLVVRFAGGLDPATDQTVANGVAVYWNDGSGFSAERVSRVPALEGGSQLLGVTALNADAGKSLELAVATQTGVFLARLQEDRSFAPPGLILEQRARGLVSGDVDGDGLLDLVFRDETGRQVFVLRAQPNQVADQEERP